MKPKILIATGNAGKFREIAEQLAALPYEFISLTEAKIDAQAPETGTTYAENALQKARFYAKKTGLPTLADDSGIEVFALKSEMGVHTRRWGAGSDATDEEWLAFFLNRMKREQNRHARFACTIAWVSGTEEQFFEGVCDGEILSAPAAPLERGIPLSAVFLPEGETAVFSALPPERKAKISHRGRAVAAAAAALFKPF